MFGSQVRSVPLLSRRGFRLDVRSVVSTRAVVDVAALRVLLMAFEDWWNDQRQEAVAYLIEENRQLIARKWTHARGHYRRQGVLAEIRGSWCG